jgi:c-di-GMP-binding flagellar brake protein YcgR
MSNSNPKDRRKHERLKLRVPIVIQPDLGDSPIRGATADLSLGGCYIETIFPLPMGTNLDLQLSLGNTVLIAGT